MKTSPSQAHYLMAELQKKHHVRSITQNIDDLHERAGSHSVTHLHGSIQFLVPKGFRHKNIAGHGVMIFMQVIVVHTLARNFVPTLFFLAKNL